MGDETDVEGLTDLERQGDLAAALLRLAERQYRTVARWQLLRVGFTHDRIRHLVERGWLRPVHRGVYVVGPGALSDRGRWMAATLMASQGVTLVERSAGALWSLAGEGRDVEVASNRQLRGRAGVRVRHLALARDEVTVHDGIPVTTVARTLLDLAAVLPRDRLARALERAVDQRMGDATGLATLLERHPRRPGTPALKRLLDERAPISKSELERRFAAFVDAHDLPRSLRNLILETYIRPYECDAVYPEARLVVELDGWQTHRTREQFEEDSMRDRALMLAGWRVVRVTWRQLRFEPARVAADLRALLRAAAA